MLRIYHNPRCSKSREALEKLKERGLNPEIIEYLQTPLDVNQLATLLAKSNLSVRQAMRTNESIYKDLELESANDEKLLQAIASHPILLNRPLVETEKGVRLGRPFELIEEIL